MSLKSSGVVSLWETQNLKKMFGVKSKCYEQCSAVMTHISSICNQKNNVINFNRKGPGFVGSA